MIKLKRENLKKFFDNVSEKYPLFLPLKNGANTDYGCYDGVKEFDLDTLKTSKSPKDVFFPQKQAPERRARGLPLPLRLNRAGRSGCLPRKTWKTT